MKKGKRASCDLRLEGDRVLALIDGDGKGLVSALGRAERSSFSSNKLSSPSLPEVDIVSFRFNICVHDR